MRRIQSTSFLTALVIATLLSGCGSSGVGDILGGGRDTRTSDDRYGNSISDVRGTVERVDTLNQRIYVDGEAGYRNDLRNGDDELVLYYDDRTVVEHDGRTYRPQDLERGDRIAADVEQSGDRLFVEQIEVLYDATAGGIGGTRDDDLASNELRGTVRYVDTRDRTVEIERSSGYSSGRDNIVVVRYDTRTIVEFEGRRYNPENLERGDVVEVELSNTGGQLLAQEILVVADANSR
ncbi:MAG TPA: DUF5666 domain-containing protein [Thermoanaerobaculia bacterium]